ncbi:MAG: hypothetical protein Q4D06_09065 [Coriobacteriia bacterium]|nr:hypothetical protein [Coriobacteriia bacterium]
MKDAKQFLADLQENADLATAFSTASAERKASGAELSDEEELEFLTSFATEHGYEVEPEELSLAIATNRDVDDSALANIAGGSGKGWCAALWACLLVLNNCVVSDECRYNESCDDLAA